MTSIVNPKEFKKFSTKRISAISEKIKVQLDHKTTATMKPECFKTWLKIYPEAKII